MPTAGELVVIDFPGAQGIKRRPALIVSSDMYHRNRPDVIVGLITSQVASVSGPTDYVLQDWSVAGLNKPSAFLWTVPRSAIGSSIGRVSDRDHVPIVACVRAALA